MQEYLIEGNKSTEISKLLFKARGSTLDIKTQKKWKYDDNLCVGCNLNIETIEEVLVCPKLGDKKEMPEKISNILFSDSISDSISDMVDVATQLRKRLRTRQQIIEGRG